MSFMIMRPRGGDGIIKYEMDIPSSPFVPSIGSSRRDSFVSSAFSANSPIGTTGPDTPSSYASQVSFEPSMVDMSAPELSFASTALSNDFTSLDMLNDYDLKTGWNDGRIQDNSNLNINIGLNLNPHGYTSLQGISPSIYTSTGDDVFGIPTTTAADTQWMYTNSTIVPDQMHNLSHFPIVTSAYTTPTKAQKSFPHELPLRSNYPHYSSSYSPPHYDASPTRRQTIKTEIKKERKARLCRSGSIIKTPPKKQKVGVETDNGGLVAAELANGAKYPCLWAPCESKFVRSEHMYRHLKGIHIEPARRSGKPIPENVQEYLAGKPQKPTKTPEPPRADLRPHCAVCKDAYSRNDNLTQHYEKVHFTDTAQSKGRKIRLIFPRDKNAPRTNETLMNWDEIAKYPREVYERAQEFLHKERERLERGRTGAMGRLTRKGSRKEKIRTKNRLSSSSLSPTSSIGSAGLGVIQEGGLAYAYGGGNGFGVGMGDSLMGGL